MKSDPVIAPPEQRPAWRRIAAHLEARLLLALAAAATGLWIFLSLAGEVREGETTGFDRTILLFFRRTSDLGSPIGPRWVQESARDITALGGFTVLTLLSLVAVILLLAHRRRAQAMVFAATVLVAQAAAELIKALVGRARPELVPQHDLVYSSSFPSGHSMMTPVVYLTLAGLLAAGETSRTAKIPIMTFAAFLVVAVGVSRVYLGVHWPTDVIAGWALGSTFAAAAAFILHRVAPRKGAVGQVKPDAPPTRLS